MKFNVQVTEDSITPYLNDIENRLHASEEEIIFKIGTKFAEEATARAPFWKGNIYDSVRNQSQWQIAREGDFITLDIVFSGVAEEVDEWWSEFEDEGLPAGGRDYAYYQETGIDQYASPEGAKSKGYVARSVKPTQKFANEYLQVEIKRIMGL